MKALRRSLCAVVIAIVTAIAGLVIACGNGDKEPKTQTVAGDEVGVYYCSAGSGIEDYLLTLDNDGKTMLVMGEDSYTGTYSLLGSALTLNYKGAVGTVNATYVNSTITFTYNGVELKFLKQIMYTVTFDSNGGSEVAAQEVCNGKTLGKPADPTRDGYVFIGWYKDSGYKTPFMFGTEAVTESITLYARWVAVSAGESEFTVKFDLNYAGAESMASRQTLGGKLYNIEEPTRSGYTFKGWWVSMTNKADELSYKVGDDVTFYENTTVYALWQANDTNGRLPTPTVSVTETGLNWDSVGSTASGYTIVIIGPDGYRKEDSVTKTSYDIDFSALDAGDYKIEVTARSSAGAAQYSETSVRVYRNKALARVSLFGITDETILGYNAVANAESYNIYIDCGDKGHVHYPIDNGKSTNYNFANCLMQEGGIKFIVEAIADGYYPSRSEVYVYNRVLDAVTGLKVDAETENVGWNSVANATGYVVSVALDGKSYATVEIGNKTSYSIKEVGAGEVTVNVYPKADGYNSPTAEVCKYTKTTLAAPSGLNIVGNELRWTGVVGAKYKVSVAGKEYDTAGNTFDLTKSDISDTNKEYVIKVMSVDGSKNSLWSDALDARYYLLESTLGYDNNTVSWAWIIGADSYDIRVNDGEPMSVSGVNSAKVTLTKSGNNKIEVRFDDGGAKSNWTEITVKAYEIELSANGGAGVSQKLYYATGDIITFPDGAEMSKTGHHIDGWYNTAVAAPGNGLRILDGSTFNASADVTLYANWVANKYVITLDYNEIGLGEVAEVEVTYGQPYTLPLPSEITNGMYVFIGWYTETGSASLRLTDDLGKSYSVWDLADDYNAYAQYSSMLGFTMQGNGTYMVVPGEVYRPLTGLTIPATYQGANDKEPIAVTLISETALNSFVDLVSISIPNTVTYIDLTVFNPCVNLQSIDIYKVDGYNEFTYETHDGVLFYNNSTTDSYDIWAYPRGKKDVSYTVPYGVSIIQSGVFYGNSYLEEVIIPATVKNVGTRAFNTLENLNKITFLSDSTFVNDGGKEMPALDIEPNAFYGCNVTQITLPARYDENFDAVDFNGLDSLTKVIIEPLSKYKVDNENMVYLSGSLNTLVFCPHGISGDVTTSGIIGKIAKGAFSGCGKITSVTISASVSAIDEYAFAGYFYSVQNSSSTLRISPCSLTKVVFAGRRIVKLVIGEYAFGNIVTNIYDLACKLDEVVFEEGCNVTEIGANCFMNCRMKTITLPLSLEVIGDEAFASCTNLVAAYFEDLGNDDMDADKTLTIGDGIFNNCSLLKSLYLPYYFSLEGNTGIFSGCTNLEKIDIDPRNPYLSTDEDGVIFDADRKTIYYYPLYMSGDYDLPASVEVITSGVFYARADLTGITIHENVRFIGDNAFSICTALKYVNFVGERSADTPLTIGKQAFYRCSVLTEMILPEGVTEISDSAFMVSGLRTLHLPSTVTYIGANAFAQCTKLVGEELEDGSIGLFIPKSVENIGYSAFYYCSFVKVVFEDGRDKALNMLQSNGAVAMPSPLVSYGEGGVTCTFENCTSLTTVILPELLVNIGGRMFYRCTKLNNVDIPRSVKFIGEQAFSDCTSLRTLTFEERGDNDILVISDSVLYDYGYGDWEFYGVFKDTVLDYVELPRGLTYIPQYTFAMLYYLKQVKIPNTVYNQSWATKDSGCAIGAYAFYDARYMTSIIVEDGGQGELSFGTEAFYNCGLSTLELPSKFNNLTVGGVEQPLIGDAFTYCSYLAAINIAPGGRYSSYGGMILLPNGEGYLGDGAEIVYSPKRKTGELDLPYYVTSVASGAFASSYITGLTFDDVPSDMYEKTAVGKENTNYGLTINGATDSSPTTSSLGAFYNSNIAELVLPARLEYLGHRAFASCSALTSLTFRDGCGIESIGNGAFYNNTKLTEVDLSGLNNLTELCNNAFLSCTALTEIKVPNTLETIGNNAFDGDKALALFVMDNGSALRSIGNAAFRYTAITSFYVPDNFNSDGLGSDVFYGCTQLSSVSLPDTITKLDVFGGCSALGKINIRALSDSPSIIDDDGVLYIKDSNGGQTLTYYPSSKKDSQYTVQAGTTAISGSVFAYNPYIRTVNIPNTVVSIGEKAFYMASLLQTVNFAADDEGGASKLDIDSYAFAATRLSSINLPKRTNSIGAYAFAYTTLLDDGLTIDAASSLVEILDYAFYYSGITSINLPEVLDSIGACAFQYSAIERITIPKSVGSVGNYAFANCDALEAVEIKDGDKTLGFGDYVFYYDKALENLTLARITATGSYMAASCTALKTITLPDTLITINDNAFSSCILLGYNESGDGANGVFFGEQSECTTIENNAFYNCRSLKKIELPKSISSIYSTSTKNAFLSAGLTEITLPSSLNSLAAFSNMALTKVAFVYDGKTASSVPAKAFSGMTSLKEVTIDNGYTSIGELAFANTSIESIVIPNSVSIIGNGAFQNCARLTSITFDPNSYIFEWLSSDSSVAATIFSGCTALKSIALPEGIRTLGKNLFDGLETLESVTLPSTLVEISEFAFRGTGIKSITIPLSVAKIDIGAFYGAQSLSSVTFEAGSAELAIEAYAFYKTGLTSVAIPARTVDLGGYAFYGAQSLSSVTFGQNIALKALYGGTFGKTAISSIELPASVKTLYANPFAYCADLEEIKPESGSSFLFEGGILYDVDMTVVYAVAAAALEDDITLADSIIEICDEAFISSGIKTLDASANKNLVIGNAAFRECYDLESVTLAENTKLASNVFANCNGLRIIKVGDGTTAVGNITLGVEHDDPIVEPDNIQLIYRDHAVTQTENGWYITVDGTEAAGFFANDTELEGVAFADGITQIPEFMFSGCTSLKFIIFGDNITSIGEYAFENCTGLQELYIPKTVTSIGLGAFAGCNALESVTLPFTGETSSKAGNFGFIFGASTYTYNTVYVPSSIKTVVIDGTITELPTNAFRYCIYIEEVSVLGEITGTGSSAFGNCSSLKTLILGPNFKSFGYSVFTGAPIENLYLPVSWNNTTYAWNSSIKRIYYAGTLADWLAKSYTAYTYSPLMYGAELYIDGKRVVASDFAFPEDMTAIGNYAMLNMGLDIDKLVIPSRITSIGKEAFYGNTIRSIVFEASEDRLTLANGSYSSATMTVNHNSGVFGGIYGLTSIDFNGRKLALSSSAELLPQATFAGCTELVEIKNLSDTITSIGVGAFAYCTSLTSFTIPAAVTVINSVAFGNSGLTSIEIPSGVASIASSNVFYNCKDLKSVTFKRDGNGDCELTTIGTYAFRDCVSLESISIPRSVATIGNYAFYGCTNLKTVTLERDDNGDCALTSLGTYVFRDCESLESFAIPKSVKTVSNYLFYGCSSLESVTFEKNGDDDVITSIGNYAFYGCSSLTEIALPSTLTAINTYAFANSGIMKISLPASLTTIGTYAFENCLALAEVTFEYDNDGKCKITTLPEGIFAGCTSLELLVVPSSVTVINASAFRDWTSAQTIRTEGIKGPSLDWAERWGDHCNADIVWSLSAEESDDTAQDQVR